MKNQSTMKGGVASTSEEGSLSSDSNSTGDEKTIPFLRRLRDMLVENHDVISFVPGNRNNRQSVMGRIIVHDRIKMEASILPRYFNHSSFASLRRQLNYFSFVRLGKGRQRESTYINDDVVELDDILNLKRRSASGNHPFPTAPTVVQAAVVTISQKQKVAFSSSQHRPPHKDGPAVTHNVDHGPKSSTKSMVASVPNVNHSLSIPTTNNKRTSIISKIKNKQHAVKRARLGTTKKAVAVKPRTITTTTLPRTSNGPLVSEDERSSSSTSSSSLLSSSTMSVILSQKQQRPSFISLDLALPTTVADKELLAGCTALLGLLSGKVWE